MVAAELVEDVVGRRLFDMASAIIPPDALVDAVVEVEMLQMLEFRAAGRE
jgi:hypothetical protein